MSVERLARATIPAPVKEVVALLREAGFAAYLVGGCVRDLLLGQQPKDWDVATAALPAEVQRTFRRVIPTGIDHGTVTVVHHGQHVEVTTFRSEADYVDGRRPSSVQFHSDIEADLARRDFTINAMAYAPGGDAPVDPFGGQRDLEAKLIRCVRSAPERFGEDGLRALRAVRFAAVLGFEIEAATFAAIPPTLNVFRRVALERVKEEFQKLLLSPRAQLGLELLDRSGLLGAFFPEAVGADFAACARAPSELPVRLAVLCARCEAPKDVVLRLKFPSAVAAAVAHLRAAPPIPASDAADSQLRRWLASVGLDAVPAALSLAVAEDRAPASVVERLLAVAATRPPLTAKALALGGHELMRALGVGPSPLIGEATRHLLELVLDDPARNTPDQLLAALRAKFPTASPHSGG